jgi:hypothetical protein
LLRRKKFPFLHVPFIFFLWAKGTTNLAEPEKHSRTDTYVFSTWWLVDVERTESTWLSLFGRLGTGSSTSCYIRRVFFVDQSTCCMGKKRTAVSVDFLLWRVPTNFSKGSSLTNLSLRKLNMCAVRSVRPMKSYVNVNVNVCLYIFF